LVNHLKRRLQVLSKKLTEKELLKIIRGYLLKYMGRDRSRQQAILPIQLGNWGTVKQLIDCLRKKPSNNNSIMSPYSH
uniref:IS4 family transposase n=1 Tax=Anisakis simplex TaxID=6269 RepID=A0A0M3JGQ6_ANISI